MLISTNARRRLSANLLLMLALPSLTWAAAPCSNLRIEPTGSDRYTNQARCGADKHAVKTGQIVLQAGGYLELAEAGDSAQASRVRCEGYPDRKLVFTLRDGASWPLRLSAQQCSWLNGKLACAGEPSVCVVETPQPVKQRVAVYATVQLRAAIDDSAADQARISAWLEGQRSVLDFCRQRFGAIWPVELALRFSKAGGISADDTSNEQSKRIGACVVQRFGQQLKPVGVTADYSITWRLEQP